MTDLADDLDRTTHGARGKVRGAAIMACFGFFCISCGDQTPNYKMAVLASGSPLINSIGFAKDGRLFAGQVLPAGSQGIFENERE